MGRRLGDLAWAILPRRRAIALRNLALVFPGMTVTERRRLARTSFEHLGLMTVEISRARVQSIDRTLGRIDIDGLEHLQTAMAEYGRAMLVTAHLGNWEFLSYAHRLSGFPVSIVVRPLDAPWMDAEVRRIRQAAGVDIIDKRDAVRPVLQALRHGRMVAILLDQNATRREGVFVPFFGRLASTSRSAATIAVRTGTPIVPLFTHREPDHRHRVTVERPLIAPTGVTVEESVVELTAACARAIETAILRAPDQWLWMHDRWRTRPVAPGSERRARAPSG